jgi:hypothetical protein
MIRCGVRSVLINGIGFRHTILSAITQLLDSVCHFRSVISVGCDAVTYSCNGNHGANRKPLKIDGLVDRFIARLRKFAKIHNYVFRKARCRAIECGDGYLNGGSA